MSDTTTVICLDDYHANDRAGRKVTGRTALEGAEQNFDLMYEQLKALKEGKTVAKPIYNHVNGCVPACVPVCLPAACVRAPCHATVVE